jgi:hypothetical protein
MTIIRQQYLNTRVEALNINLCITGTPFVDIGCSAPSEILCTFRGMKRVGIPTGDEHNTIVIAGVVPRRGFANYPIIPII